MDALDRMRGLWASYEGRVRSCSTVWRACSVVLEFGDTTEHVLHTVQHVSHTPAKFRHMIRSRPPFCHLHKTTWRGKWNVYQQYKKNVTILFFLKCNFISNSSYFQRESLITSFIRFNTSLIRPPNFVTWYARARHFVIYIKQHEGESEMCISNIKKMSQYYFFWNVILFPIPPIFKGNLL